MTKKSDYSKKLVSPLWQKKRLEILNLHGFKCEKCGCEDKELHVHHRFYITGREVWQYDNDVFQVLCCDCHEKEHSKKQQYSAELTSLIDFVIKYMDNDDIDNLMFFIENSNESKNLKEYLDLLCFCSNHIGLPERIFDILWDKRNVELLDMQLSEIMSKLKEILPDTN